MPKTVSDSDHHHHLLHAATGSSVYACSFQSHVSTALLGMRCTSRFSKAHDPRTEQKKVRLFCSARNLVAKRVAQKRPAGNIWQKFTSFSFEETHRSAYMIQKTPSKRPSNRTSFIWLVKQLYKEFTKRTRSQNIHVAEDFHSRFSASLSEHDDYDLCLSRL